MNAWIANDEGDVINLLRFSSIGIRYHPDPGVGSCYIVGFINFPTSSAIEDKWWEDSNVVPLEEVMRGPGQTPAQLQKMAKKRLRHIHCLIMRSRDGN